MQIILDVSTGKYVKSITDVVEIEVRLPDLAMGYPDLLAILAGERACGLSPPPAEIVLA